MSAIGNFVTHHPFPPVINSNTREHTMTRFSNGVPQTMWFSQHAAGEAFDFSAVPKYNGGLRPIVYSANGSHANYATSGKHDHTLPGLDLPIGVFLVDYTDQGHLWDPTLSAYYASVSFPSGSRHRCLQRTTTQLRSTG